MSMSVVSLNYLCLWQVQASVYCTKRIPAHLRCTQCSIMLHLIDICFLTCIWLWQISQIQTCLRVIVGPGLVSTSPAFMRSIASQPADPHGWIYRVWSSTECARCASDPRLALIQLILTTAIRSYGISSGIYFFFPSVHLTTSSAFIMLLALWCTSNCSVFCHGSMTWFLISSSLWWYSSTKKSFVQYFDDISNGGSILIRVSLF